MFVSHIIVSWLVLNMKRKVTITNTAEEMEKPTASFGVKKKKKKKICRGSTSQRRKGNKQRTEKRV